MCEERITYSQPYEIVTKFDAETDSSGNIKPWCEVTIIRRVKKAEEIFELVKADLRFGAGEAIDIIKAKLAELPEFKKKGKEGR